MARAFSARFISLFDGKAPKVVLDNMKKVKVITVEFSAASQMIFEVWEIDDKDLVDTAPIFIYFNEVVQLETYVVQKAEDWSKSWDMLELLDKVPPPK